MADISLSFSAEGGISLDDLVGIFTGTIDPSVSGETAPLGSLFIKQDGKLFQKVGLLDTDWIRFSQGLGEAVKISATDSTSGYLNNKLAVSSAISKTIQNGGSNETLLLDLSNIGTAGTYRSVTTDAKGRVIAGTNPTTLAGYGIVDAQPLDATLTSLASYATTGFLALTALDTFAGRSIVGTTNQITVTNGAGTAGNPTLSFPSTLLTFPGTAGIIPPKGTTAQRIATQGYTRFNTTTSRLEYYTGTKWVSIDPATGGTVTSVDMTVPQGLSITGNPITTSGTLALSLANDLAAIENLTSVGFAVRTNTDTWSTRLLSGTTDRIDITNADGLLSNPTFDIASTYAGQSSITTLGVIGTGTWQGTTIGTQFGGTGRTTIGGANTLLGVNTGASGLEYKTLVNGNGIGLSLTAQQISLSNTGVLSLTGTANQVNVSASTGNITLSLPQSIATTSSPTFNKVTVAADPTLPLEVATKQYVDNAIQGLDSKLSVRVATSANISLSGLVTSIDGITLNNGDRVLVKNQTSSLENGIYIVDSIGWVRASDFNAWTEIPSAYTFVEEGSLADTGWICTADQNGVLGTTAITWVQFSSAGVTTASTGLIKVGNDIRINNTITPGGPYNNITFNAQGLITGASNVSYLTSNQTIVLSGDVTGNGTNAITTLLSNTGVTAGTYKSVTVDAKGRISAGTNPTTLAGFGITDAQPLNTYLTSQSNLATDGIVVKSGNSSLTRTILVGSSKLSISNGDGIAGNPTLDVVEANLSLNNISGTLNVSKGGTGLSALGSSNQLLGVNALGTSSEYKTISGTGITISHSSGGINFATVNNGTVTSVGVTGSTGLTVSGSPITSSGTIALTLGTELQGLSSVNTLGVVTRTAAGTYTTRNITSSSSTLSISNPAGTIGNISVDLIATGIAGTYKSVTTDAYGRVVSGTNPTTLSGFGITDAVSSSLLGAVNGVATLDASGKLSSSQIPASAITDTFVVANQAAQTSLTAEVGDVAVRTDLNKSFILKTLPASVFANWQELLTPTSGVTSVNGQTGIVNVGTVTSVGITPPAAGISVTNSPVTTSGNISLALANDLAAIENIGTTGIAVRTAADTWTTRTLIAGSGITITNANGTAGDITISSTSGTVSSVGLSLPSIFTVTNSPVTSSGTLTGTLNVQPINAVLAGPTIGSPAVPTFRTLGLATNDINDVTISSAALGQVLSYNGSRWVNSGAIGSNAAGLVGVGQTGGLAWSLVSGTRYQADFAHNLGTFNVVVSVFDTSNNAIVIPDSIVLTSTNNVRITVVGNTKTLRVVVVANGQSIVAGGSTPSSVVTAKDGVTVSTAATKLNFTGQAVNVVDAGSGTTSISIGARYSYFANSLDTPNNADFAINSLAPVVTDPTYNSLNVRSFSNTTEQGVGFTCSIPNGATQVTIRMRGRSQTAQATATIVQPRLYSRLIPNNAAVGTWSTASELANISIPANAFFQSALQTIPLSTLGLTAGNLYQFELTRRIAGVTGTNLPAPFLLCEITLEFA